MMKLSLLLFLSGAAFLLHAQAKPNSTSYFDASLDGVIAQFVDGGAWKTTVTLVNLDTTPSDYTLSFYGNNGSPMTMTTNAGTGKWISGTLPVGGSAVIETPGTAAALSQGWALLHSPNNVGGNAIFKQTVAGKAFAASLPIVTYVNAHRYVMPFDETNSATGVPLVNPLSYTSATVYVTFRDSTGAQFLLDNLTLGALQHTAFNLSDRFPQCAGKHGTVEFDVTEISMGMLGLRFAGGSFTAVLPMTSLTWY